MTNRLLCRFFFWLAGPATGKRRWWRPVDSRLFSMALWFRVRHSSELSPVRRWWRRTMRRPMATHLAWHTESDRPVGLACSCTLRPIEGTYERTSTQSESSAHLDAWARVLAEMPSARGRHKRRDIVVDTTTMTDEEMAELSLRIVASFQETASAARELAEAIRELAEAMKSAGRVVRLVGAAFERAKADHPEAFEQLC